jgi:hypothetical protein
VKFWFPAPPVYVSATNATGEAEGRAVGALDGSPVGYSVGAEGSLVGFPVGFEVGIALGKRVFCATTEVAIITIKTKYMVFS